MPETIDLSTFQPCVGETFTVQLDGGAYPLTLSEATALPSTHFPGKNRDPFQLKFIGPGPHCLRQHIYQLEDSAQRKMEIFLVPIGPNGSGFVYQAVFT